MAPKIITEGNPTLRQTSKEVPQELFDTPELEQIIADMSQALRGTEHGVAIAAPQIDIPYRIFLVAGFVIAQKEKNIEDPDMAFINPTIKKLSRKKELMDEGCLSVPNVYGKTKRSVQATVVAYDMHGKKFERGGSDLLAQIFQHECDHLNGTLFIDHATDLQTQTPKNEHEQ